MGNRVVVLVDRDVVVNVDAHRVPLGILVGFDRQGPHGGAIHLLKCFPAAPGELLEGALVEFLEQLCNGLV